MIQGQMCRLLYLYDPRPDVSPRLSLLSKARCVAYFIFTIQGQMCHLFYLYDSGRDVSPRQHYIGLSFLPFLGWGWGGRREGRGVFRICLVF